MGFATSLVNLLLVGNLNAQLDPPSLEADNLANISAGVLDDCETRFCRPGVRNRSQSRGVVIRYERQGAFNWRMNNPELEGGNTRVAGLEQFTFKFKIPLINQPGTKLLLGYEWDTEKYYFADLPPISPGRPPTLWQLLDERRLKAAKLSAYFTKSFDDRYYLSARVRLSLQGDYDGFVDFDPEYRTYSGAVAFGKKVNADTEWGVGLTYSTNAARTVVLPFLFYNRTWNDRWGLESALPAQVFLRYNVDPARGHAFRTGVQADSKFYVINSLGDRGRFENLNEFYLRRLGLKALTQYEHKLGGWFWAFAQGGVYIPINARFNEIDAVDVDLMTSVEARPFFRVGLFLAPPKELIR